MIEHPSGERLESFAAGDADTGVELHLRECAACSEYVERLIRALALFRKTEGARAEQFAEQVMDLARTEAPDPLEAGGAPLRKNRRLAGPTRLARGGVLVPFVLAAAVLVVWLRGPKIHGSALLDPRLAPTSSTSSSPTRFKGDVVLSVIRERQGDQQRFVGEVTVHPGDRLRIQVDLQRSRVLAGLMLADDGTRVTLLGPEDLGPGVHFSEQAVRFDGNPTGGWIVLGEPADIVRAMGDAGYDDLHTLRVRATSEP